MTVPHHPLRVAIIGTGGIAHAHAQAVTELAGKATLVAVADVDLERAQALAAEFGAARLIPMPVRCLKRKTSTSSTSALLPNPTSSSRCGRRRPESRRSSRSRSR